MLNIYSSKSTVSTSEGVAVLDHSFAPAELKLKTGFSASEYHPEADERQRMALSVAWHSKCTQSIKADYLLRDKYMADIVQACMLASLEEPDMSDTDAVWFRKYRNEDGELVVEVRDEIRKLTAEELQVRFKFKHIERACRKEVQRLFDLHMRECLVQARDEEATEEAFDRVTAKRTYDEYMQGDGSEFDKLDNLLAYAGKYLSMKQTAQLKALVSGTAKLSDLNSTTRRVLRTVVLGTLHMDSILGL